MEPLQKVTRYSSRWRHRARELIPMIIASPVMKHFPLERRRAPLRDKMRCRTVSETSDSECFSWILAMHLISGDMHSLIRIFIKNDQH
ncbi:hypothetical protein CEXT_17931 [Caerostris extrusa]|uniref:Uncharacterized protein n=1 Tax=Caerostris extrusa TaxID=172846 RepID=A0AAV4UK61_CAEEX|nr:hypothetical protein CEXT_17931 [Caerostris extrusa]